MCICSYIGCENEITDIGKINRAQKVGLRLFCSRKCFGLDRRKPILPLDKKKQLKADYDREYRKKNRDLLKKKKHDYFKKTYNPEKQREYNQLRMSDHIEYCRQPKYQEYKQRYDSQYRAKKIYGDFWEVAIVLFKLEAEINRREAFRINKLYLKSTQQKKRKWQRTTQTKETLIKANLQHPY